VPGSTWSWTTRLLFLLLIVAWGLNYLFVSIGLTAASPLWLALFRSTVGAAGTFVLVAAFHAGPALDARGRRDAFLLGIPNTGLFFGLWFVAAQNVLPGFAAVLIYTFPLWVALLSAPVLGHRLSRSHWSAVALGFVGVALVSQVWEVFGVSTALASVVELLLAAVAWGGGTVLFQRRFGASHAVEGSAWGLLGGSVFLAIVLMVMGPYPLPRFADPSLWASVAWMSLVGTAIAYAIWYTLLSRTPAAVLSAYVFLVPVVALSASAVFFFERLTLIQLVGVALVLIAIYTIGRSSARVATAAATSAQPR